MSQALTQSRPTGGTYRDTVLSLAAAQKVAAPGAPPYSVYINRRAGRYLAAACHRAGLTPNAVSVISAAFTFTGIGMIAFGNLSWGLGIAVWLCLAVGYAFDAADGQVARLRGGGSLSGEWLDHVVDSAKLSSIHLAVLIGAYRGFELSTPLWLLVPLGFCVVAAVAFFSMILNDHLKEIHSLKTGAVPAKGSGSRLKSLLLIPTDYGFLCLTFVLLGAPPLFMALYTVVFVANLGHLVLASIKWFRDMGRLDASARDRRDAPSRARHAHAAGSAAQ
ncbi:CDP-alcohol phosphatidyltransferase family protein [Arthrobacter sp. 260]|uniref:CDP-alcohol phosphatidyltransferase family protein n=1 Tax=Arthrobacter sp. 260 TaxID=2735314 RepID=UPI00149172E6|nr:CDP-alcohol phosphatidyltransferase family protein [Arthrobacter sp. 260]NOJ60762.1 CDP-alcohol phosphatidyltransferase family protein [Arthrobacter sp. 260]